MIQYKPKIELYDAKVPGRLRAGDRDLLRSCFRGPAGAGASRPTTAPRSIGGPAEVHYAPGEDLESIDIALIREAVKQVEAQTCYNDRLSDGKPNPCTV